MDKVKASIKEFTSHSGHHDTTVHEKVAPAVQHETVKPHQHEEINTAVDKEVHQDHYHRSVQPVHDRKVLPEKHTANIGAVQHREFDNRDHEHTKRALVEGQSGFKDHQVVQDTSHSQSINPTVGGEHVHHHVHETIQPVVHKETIQPNVVHTTVPIHETHHNPVKHHNTSELPPVTMDEFKTKGGVLGGRGELHDGFEGEPKNIGEKLSGLVGGHKKHDSHHGNEHVQPHATHGDHTSNPLHQHNDRVGNGASGIGGTGLSTGKEHVQPHGAHGDHRSDPIHQHSDRVGNDAGVHGGTGLPSSNRSDSIGGLGAGAGAGTGSTLNNTSHTHKKPGLMDKVNPKTDSNGDGVAGFMK